ncbi:hypothetical protein L9F63_005983 [Diploptera punctata]|uniref:Protein takeout n=1 Tax=Diploptera punctata TaxID=6984 RepID=A0AAD8E5N9_DIPPU|nr:hypothetical protein L9F63_005983 [Diploptera punctata]
MACTGIPELGVTEIEPVYIDEIAIALVRDLMATELYSGTSKLRTQQLDSRGTDLDTLQFQLSFYAPLINARAHYRSSGVLIMVKASGGGDYWGEYEGVKAKVYFRARPHQVQGHTFLQVEDAKMDFAVRNIKMGIENLHNGNDVMKAALNLFINSNSQELLQEMKPDIKKKMLLKMKNFINNVFTRIPYDMWVVD